MSINKLSVFISILLAVTFWSLSFVWYKLALQHFGPITIIFLRLIISAPFLFILTYVIKKLQVIKIKDIKLFILLSFFEPFLYFVGESYGMTFISSTLAAVIVSTIPLFTPLVARYYFNERLTLTNFIGIVISIFGVVLVVFHRGFTRPVDASWEGISLMMLAVFSTLGYGVMVKKLTYSYNSFSIVAYQNFIGIFFFAPLFFILEFNHFRQVELNTTNLKPIIELSVFASSFAFIFFTYGVKKIGISRANIFVNLIPVLTAVFAFFILGEALTILKVTGILVVISGLFLSQLKRRKQLLINKEPVPREEDNIL